MTCRLVKDRTLDLERETGRDPYYRGLVDSAGTLAVVDYHARNLLLHSRKDGKLLATPHKLDSGPTCFCLISNTDVAVILHNRSIEILSFKSVGITRKITRVRVFDVATQFDSCNAVAKVDSVDQLVISGHRQDMGMCWGVMFLKDGHVNTIRQICKRDIGYSHLATQYNTVYTSCWADNPTDSGVYAYNIDYPHSRKFIYQHCDLEFPGDLTLDTRGFVFVCNWYPPSIHQLTDRGNLVTIHTLTSLPRDIFYEHQQRVIYITSSWSSKIPAYRLEYLHAQDIQTEWAFTSRELLEAWESIEVYLLEELAPKNVLTFFEKEALLSVGMCNDLRKLRRRQVAEELLQKIKTMLPASFSFLLHTLNATEQTVIVRGLKKQTEGIHAARSMEHKRNTTEILPSIVYYTLRLELFKDGTYLHEIESKTRCFFDKGCMVFDYDMKSQCLKWEHGSVIVYLRPLSRLTKETLELFCQHGGMKTFVLDLLKKRDMFSSLPEGEMSIHVQVRCYDEDFESEAAAGEYRDYTQITDKHCLSHDSCTVTDNVQVIKQNLLLQYNYMVEEIEPLQFKTTFITREILDKNYFEKLQLLTRRKERAACFLKMVLDKGNTAIAALVQALRENGIDDLVYKLCVVPQISSQFRDQGQVDDSMVEVVQEEMTADFEESVVWSCHMKVAIKKNEDEYQRVPEVLVNDDMKPLVSEEPLTQSKKGVQTIVSLEQLYSAESARSLLCQVSSCKKDLPPGKKYHVFFSYCNTDIQWVKETVEKLEQDHGFICREYDRDNTPGTPLLGFADVSIRNAYKTVVVMTKEAIQSPFVLHEIDMAIMQGFVERRKCVVPVLLKDCEIPRQLSILNYVDARDSSMRDTWWPKLLTEIEDQDFVILVPDLSGYLTTDLQSRPASDA